MAGGSERANERDDHAHEGAVVVPLRGPDFVARQAPPSPPAPLHEQADPVTGLPGREQFEEYLAGAARRRRGDEHAWAAVAVLEGLSVVGEREGRQSAEALLCAAAMTLRAALRDSDKLARLGDEEFGLLIDAPFGDETMTVLARLVHQVKKLSYSRPAWYGVTLSVGVTQLWSDEPRRAVERAREALYGVRRHGGGGVAMSTGLR
jgi:diguanylate cyclase (GGDEF)-like protein